MDKHCINISAVSPWRSVLALPAISVASEMVFLLLEIKSAVKEHDSYQRMPTC